MTMIKTSNRRSVLRARASALAVLTGLALIAHQQKAMAAVPAVTVNPAYNASTCVLNVGSSVVDVDGSNRSIFVQSDGYLGETSKPGLTVLDSTLNGSFVNRGNVTFGPPGCSNSGSGTILTLSGGPAAAEFKNSVIVGGVFNQGTIDSTQNGLALEEFTLGSVSNPASTVVLENTSAATAALRAISLTSGSVYGTIANTVGYIEGGLGAGIHIEDVGATGSLENTGIVKSLNGDAVRIADSSFGGRVFNSRLGQIVGNATGVSNGAGISFSGDVALAEGLQNEGSVTGYDGVRFFTPTFGGDVVNRGDGLIRGTIDGITGLADSFTGDLRNENNGVIEGLAGFGVNLGDSYPSSGSFVGDVYNGPNARISGDQGGIKLSFATIETNFDNQGLIEMTGSGSTPLTFVGSSATWFNAETSHTGSYHNSGTIDGTSRSGAGGLLITGGEVNADIVNFSGGVISGSSVSGGFGLAIGASALNGDVLNSGQINGDIGISIGPNPFAIVPLAVQGIDIDGDVTNSGSVNGNLLGVTVYANEWTGNFTNDSGATIVAPDGQGSSLTVATWTGNFNNNGSISNGTLISSNEWNGNFTTGVDSNISNSSGTGLQIGSGDIGEIGSLDFFSALNWTGDATNNGVISGSLNGGTVNVNSFSGSFVNYGMFSGSAGTGLSIFANEWTGDWTNAQLATIQGGTTGALLDVGQFTGNATNNGRIAGGGVDTGWHIVAGNFTGDIVNNDILEAAGNALHVEITTMSGSISNNATITGGASISIADWTGNFATSALSEITSSNSVALQIGGRNIEEFAIQETESNLVWTGDFDSKGKIDGAQGGVEIALNEFHGDWKNSGAISGGEDGPNEYAVGVTITADIWDGNWTNAAGAGIQGDGTGLYFDASDVVGAFVNDGTISGANGNGGSIFGGSFSGSFTNNGTITGSSASYSAKGLLVQVDSWTGDFTNAAGATISGSATGLLFQANQVVGTLTNNGTISGGEETTGWHIVASTYTGDIVNGLSGVLDAPSNALHLEIDNLVGDIKNDGLIEATASNGVAALLASNGGSSSSYTGQLINNGSIKGGTDSDGIGLRLTTSISEGVLNTGLLKGWTAYDTRDATGATVFVQQGANALVDGDMRLSLEYADDVTFKGGALKGGIFGAGDDDDVTVDVGSGAFAFNDNTVDGIDAFTAKSGTSLLGTLVAGADGLGMTMNAMSVTVNSGANLYLDDDTVVNTQGLDVQSDASLTYFLTTNVSQHGVINVTEPDLQPLNFSIAAAPGQANVAGTIFAYLDDYDAFRTSGQSSFLYTGVIQTTGGVNGTFNAAAYAGGVPLGFQYNLSVIYGPAADPNSVDLLLSRTPFDELIDEDDASANQQEVGGALEEICQDAPAGSELADFCNYVGLLDEEEIPGAYDQVSGYQIPQITGLGLDLAELLTLPSNENNVHGTAFGTCQQAGFGWCGTQQYAALASPAQATDAMSDEDPFAWLRPGKREVGRNGLWGRYVGNWRNVEGDLNARGLRAQTHGFGAGYDHVVAEDLMIGAAALYAETTSKFSGAPEDKGDISTYQAGVYASWGDADFYVNANSTLIWNDFGTRRRIQTGPATFEYAGGSFDGFGGTAFVELGTVLESEGFRFQPLASLFYLTHTTDEFTETGAGTLNLVVREATTESLRSQLGGRLAHPFKWGDTRLVPEIRAAWRHEFLDVRQDSLVNFALVPLANDMKIVGSETSRDMAVLGFGLSASLGRSTVLYSDVDGAFSNDKTSVQASIGLRHSW